MTNSLKSHGGWHLSQQWSEWNPWLVAGTHKTLGSERKERPEQDRIYIWRVIQDPRWSSSFPGQKSPSKIPLTYRGLLGFPQKGRQIPSAGISATPVSFQMKWRVLSKLFRYNSCPQKLVIMVIWGQGLEIVTHAYNHSRASLRFSLQHWEIWQS